MKADFQRIFAGIRPWALIKRDEHIVQNGALKITVVGVAGGARGQGGGTEKGLGKRGAVGTADAHDRDGGGAHGCGQGGDGVGGRSGHAADGKRGRGKGQINRPRGPTVRSFINQCVV